MPEIPELDDPDPDPTAGEQEEELAEAEGSEGPTGAGTDDPALPVRVAVERELDAPPEAAFDAWIDPKLVARWMFGPPLRDEEVQGISVAPRAGGSFSFRVLRDGELLDHAGRYLELDRPRRLAFTWGVRQYLPESSRVYLDFRPSGRGSALTLVHRMPADAADHADQIRRGWTAMLDELARVLDASGEDPSAVP